MSGGLASVPVMIWLEAQQVLFSIFCFVRKSSIAEGRSRAKDAVARLVIWWALGMGSGQRNKAIDNASNSRYVYTRR